MANPNTDLSGIDYRLAFDLAPLGLALSRQRTIVDCNQALCEMFGAAREQLVGQSFQVLYPSADEYERTGARITPILGRSGTYADDRVMKRVDGRFKGETFWCHVTGRALRREAPHEAGIWSFEDLSSRRAVRAELDQLLGRVTEQRACGRVHGANAVVGVDQHGGRRCRLPRGLP